jgi:hypothetical protein
MAFIRNVRNGAEKGENTEKEMTLCSRIRNSV